jgi:hypothetical protein
MLALSIIDIPLDASPLLDAYHQGHMDTLVRHETCTELGLVLFYS